MTMKSRATARSAYEVWFRTVFGGPPDEENWRDFNEYREKALEAVVAHVRESTLSEVAAHLRSRAEHHDNEQMHFTAEAVRTVAGKILVPGWRFDAKE